ncbi:fibrinogen C domain-containing protein 1-A-like [Dreissena polymorpha]|uniref:Fibrinogen C-terminal domain-containing protein n=1 Tax=Dreissena polymorpha TaxID=45954 RepID=A0A9D4H234_DREPO|nr:fibrinogen C domain-containing protein 1-A-like [Dreissena polymorpha]KAH3827994.1 hypothetical protein DPMN_129942 [Dreissena polymorpha]
MRTVLLCFVGLLLRPMAAQTTQASSVDELKNMLLGLQNQVAAIHSTLLTQQTMSISDVCRVIGGATAIQGPADPIDCVDVKEQGNSTSGVYVVKPNGESKLPVYCDMTTDGGGWLVIQRRQDGSQDFYKSYAEYEQGFGNLTGEFYLGNRHISALTRQGHYELRVELEDFKGVSKFAHYSSFSVGDSASKYTLHVDGYNGTAGDSLKFDHDGHKFSTADQDNDGTDSVKCAEKHHGGYWYSACFKSNLNGKWGVPGEQGIVYGSFKDWQIYVLKKSEMKIRRVK